MDVIDVAVARGVDSGIIAAVNAGEVGDACRSTIVTVGEIETGAVAQDVRKNKKMRRFDVRFM